VGRFAGRPEEGGSVKPLVTFVLVVGAAIAVSALAVENPAPIAVDYPEDGSIFPPEIIAPTFLWRDPAASANLWRIEVSFGGGSNQIRVESKGERLRIGEIDPRCVADTNKPPELTPQQAAAHTWTPDAATWTAIKAHSAGLPATVTITGFAAKDPATAVSRGSVRMETSKDPVGAPIFYRDVPLMPSELTKGVIKPLSAAAVPLIAWRLRNVAEPRSRVLMTGLHTCANCHSFSRDGKTLGMDLDGPQNDKGMYTLAAIKPQMSIRNQDVIEWRSFKGKLTGDLRVGFMSQVSPDGQYVVTTIKGPDPVGQRPQREYVQNYYVANFKDYRFLQVFYPTRGILAWYSRATGRLEPLPGADDQRYVNTNAVWTPDGKYLVFARAEARDAYPPGRKLAESANDPNETQLQYDLYRIPFNGGQGGVPEPVAGASHNGMSNTFPKVSPDGQWIVFVECRNGQLMRPDSQLYIVPLAGGQARRLRSNLPLMNSWHSFSPNGRWLVFSSKSRSPYTQMYLTHLDEQGNASPAILIDNATAANRAVNIPEFVNIPPDGLMKIDTPAVEFYRIFDVAVDLSDKGQYEAAIAEWKKALALSPDDARAHTSYGMALVRTGKPAEAIAQYRQALEIDAEYPEAHNNLGIALAGSGKVDEAIAQFEKSLEINPYSAEFHNNLGHALAAAGKTNEAMAQYRQALEIKPRYPEALSNLGVAVAGSGKPDEAIGLYQKALEIDPEYPEANNNLGMALARLGKLNEAVPHFQKFVASNPASADAQNNLALALVGTGKLNQAVPHFQKALDLSPGSADAHNNLGLALTGTGKPALAIPHFEEALKINPAFTEADANLGDAFAALGRIPEALAHWRVALRADSGNVPVLDHTARVLATNPDASIRNGAVAVAMAERAAQLSGGREPAILDTLAAAYAEMGRFPEAVETARRALALAVERKQQPLVEVLRTRIALYEAQTPFREKPAGGLLH
jgi:tetratricopeptide (TPR) repeat protein